MKLFFTIVVLLVIGLSFMFFAGRAEAPRQDLLNNLDEELPINNNQEQNMSDGNNPVAVFSTSAGQFKIELLKDKAPNTVNNFVKLAESGFYNGTRFHRVIKDFMIQGGDPLSKDPAQSARWGTGGPGYVFEDEINDTPLVQGILAMANSGPNTNGSQFFIVTAQSTPWLDGAHTPFGKVIEGLDNVLDIQEVATDASDRPLEEVVVESITIE